MITFAELLPLLRDAQKLTARDYAFSCPKCGARITIKSFGAKWSAKCPACGNLGEDDFRDANAPTPGFKAESGGVRVGRLHEKTVAEQDYASNRAVAQSVDASGLNPDDTVGSSPTSPTSSAAQPAREEVIRPHGTAISVPLNDTTASVGEADASAGIQASEGVSEHQARLRPGQDNAAPAAGVNGASGGRSYHNPKLRHAIAYARHGMRVFPVHEIEREGCSCGKLACPSAGKHPRIKDWQILATCDESEISAWWKTWPGSNIGVACGEASNVTVLDVDGDEGRWQLRDLEGENGELPETPVAITGSGGAHYYFAFEAGLGNAVKFAPGLDVRTEGGLVVGVGSRTKQPYRWEAAFTLGSEGLMPARMPQWLADKIKSASVPQTNGHLVLPGAIPAGERNNWLYRLTRSLKARGMGTGAILLAVQSENATRCSPPMPDDEIRALVEHATTELDQRGFQAQAVVRVAPPIAEPLVIPWEGFDQALIANEAYLKRVAVVDRLCFSSSVAMITGGKHAGKSTLARWMAVCVAKGWPFLGREVAQGPVFYVASEDETMAARQELIRLGWSGDDPLRFLSAQNIPYEDLDAFLMRLTDEIRANATVMCVLDMLFDFVRISDEMSYAATREAVGKIQKVASSSESLIVTSHHAPKHMNTADAAVTALGSQGLAARVSPIILVKKHGPDVHSIVSTSVRDPRGEAIEQSRLVRNSDGSMTLGGIWKDWMQAEVYRPQVLEVLEAEDDAEMTAADVAEQLEITYKLAAAALVRLYKDGKVARKGSGLKGKPYRYQIISGDNAKQPEKDVSQGRGAIHTEPSPHPNAQGAFGYKED